MPLIYALGSNGAGQLGIGHLNDVAKPEKCMFVSKESRINVDGSQIDRERKVKKIVAGGNHTLILTEEGKVFAAGRNGDGRLGLPIEGHEDEKSKFEEVDFSESEELTACFGSDTWKVTDIAATWEASFFVVNHKFILTCGSGLKGELGLGTDIQVANTMRKVFEVDEPGVHILDIAACMAHLVFITSQGLVFGWGGCRKGQLGHDLEKEKTVWSPRRLGDDLYLKPERVVVGREYTVLMRSGENPVFWGNSKFFDPKDVKRAAENDLLVSGWSSIHLLSSRPTALITSIGRNDRGQLASRTFPPLQTLATGSEHCVGITSAGKVIAWGWGEHGNCGDPLDSKGNVVGRWNEIIIPESAEGTQANRVAAGCATTFIICDRGE
ncbi:hypothetical protein LTR84_012596 [Exophiala bonariae]|uniref:RCC1-like domain-containing protein n=1 Tax=Exophiala bonariae TaxID=1690606 RepID=A0AAV9NFH0_9EURO|nr:hypothetical protein LTR84_012596 [Exophiala bonariae]